MSAELLREAANQLRIDAVVSYKSDRDARLLGFNRAVADWLDVTAADHDVDPDNPRASDFFAEFDTAPDVAAIAVARLCLGRDS